MPLDSSTVATGRVVTRRAGLAVALLSLACVFWGFSFPAMKLASGVFKASVPVQTGALVREIGLATAFHGWRFAAAAMLYYFAVGMPRNFKPVEVRGGITVGALFTGGMILQLIGVQYTKPSIAGFLTALAVIFAPLAQAIIFRRPVGWLTWGAIGVAIVGIALLSAPSADSDGPATLSSAIPALGQMLCILGAMVFTAEILAVDRFGQSARAVHLTAIMLPTTALLALGASAFTLGGSIYDREVLRPVLTDMRFVGPMLGLIIFSSVLATHLMNTFQPHLTPAIACVVYCLEPVFATVFSVAMHTEQLSEITVIGGSAVLVAVLLVAKQAKAMPVESA